MQTVTLTHGLLRYDPLEQSAPSTVMGMTLAWLPPAVTVRVVNAVTLPGTGSVTGTEAVIVVVPEETGVALPLLPALLLMVAMDVSDELQTAVAVRSWVVLSEKV